MEWISLSELSRIVEDAEVLARDDFGDKVLLTRDNRVVKLFRLKRRFSSARAFPYALRFCRNAAGLRSLGIATVTPEPPRRCPSLHRDLVIYPRVPGHTLRELLEDGSGHAPLLTGLARLLAELHHKGVYFRSLHFGNLLVREDGTMSLIDVANLRLARRPLGPWRRVRNFAHLMRYPQDRACLRAFGIQAFIDTYGDAARMGRAQRWLLSHWLAWLDTRSAARPDHTGSDPRSESRGGLGHGERPPGH